MALHDGPLRPERLDNIDALLAAAEARDWDGIDLRMRMLFTDYVAPDSWLSVRRRAGSPHAPVPVGRSQNPLTARNTPLDK
jgi:hypothetical protein